MDTSQPKRNPPTARALCLRVLCAHAQVVTAECSRHVVGKRGRPHGSGGGLFGNGWGVLDVKSELNAEALSGYGSDHSIRYAVRQDVWPLLHCLVRDANFLGGSGDGSAKKFNGFGLEHASLNHGSNESVNPG